MQNQHEQLARILALDQQGRDYHSQGQLPEAEAAFTEALHMLRELFGPKHTHVAGALQNLARIRSERGAWGEAAALGNEALTMQQELLGPNHPAVADAVLNLSGHYYAAHDYLQAKALLERAMSLFEQHYGPHSVQVSTCLNNLGRVFENMGKPHLGAQLHEQAVTIRLDILGDHPETAFSLGNWGAALAADGQWDKAFNALTQALACYTRLHLGESEAAQICQQNRALCKKHGGSATVSAQTEETDNKIL
ncbi:MAG: tetratricopeptide repeat protein [Desulfovibrionaceae bacterium]